MYNALMAGNVAQLITIAAMGKSANRRVATKPRG
jgi:hypothetical protein